MFEILILLFRSVLMVFQLSILFFKLVRTVENVSFCEVTPISIPRYLNLSTIVIVFHFGFCWSVCVCVVVRGRVVMSCVLGLLIVSPVIMVVLSISSSVLIICSIVLVSVAISSANHP